MTPGPRYSLTIPGALYDAGLSPGEREIVALVHALERSGGRCTAGAAWIAWRLAIPERTVYRTLARLRSLGWLIDDAGGLRLGRAIDGSEGITARGTTVRAAIDRAPDPAILAGRSAKMAGVSAKMAVASKVMSRDLEERGVADSESPIVHQTPLSASAALHARLGQELEERLASTSEDPSDCPETARLPAAGDAGRGPATHETPPASESAPFASGEYVTLTADELSQLPPEEWDRVEQERCAAATELGTRGVDGEAPLLWARRKSLTRILEVCAWADAGGRRGAAIVAALRDGYGHAPLPGSEAAEVAERSRDDPARRARELAERITAGVLRQIEHYGEAAARAMNGHLPAAEWERLLALSQRKGLAAGVRL